MRAVSNSPRSHSCRTLHRCHCKRSLPPLGSLSFHHNGKNRLPKRAPMRRDFVPDKRMTISQPPRTHATKQLNNHNAATTVNDSGYCRLASTHATPTDARTLAKHHLPPHHGPFQLFDCPARTCPHIGSKFARTHATQIIIPMTASLPIVFQGPFQ